MHVVQEQRAVPQGREQARASSPTEQVRPVAGEPPAIDANHGLEAVGAPEVHQSGDVVLVQAGLSEDKDGAPGRVARRRDDVPPEPGGVAGGADDASLRGSDQERLKGSGALGRVPELLA